MEHDFPHHFPAPKLIITLPRASRYYLHGDLKIKTTITATTTTRIKITTTTTKTVATPAAAVLITMDHLYHNGK